MEFSRQLNKTVVAYFCFVTIFVLIRSTFADSRNVELIGRELFGPALDVYAKDGYVISDVKTNMPKETVAIQLSGIEQLPEEYSVRIYDLDLDNWFDKNTVSFGFVSGKGLTERHFRIVVSDSELPELEEYASRPERFVTAMCFPNPFNPQTTIRYELSMSGKVTSSTYNALGQQVKVYDIGNKDQGVHEIVFDASDLTSGIYFYRVDAGYASVTGKMLYMK